MPFDISHKDAIGYGDITILDEVINASKDCDGIIHLAAISRISDCDNNPKSCIGYKIDNEEAIDIDTKSDWNYADFLLKNNHN